MVCIYCSNATQVVNSRLQRRPNQVWRRRKCLECGTVFSTHELAAYDAAWRVKSTHGKLVPFKRNKLFISLHKSLEHRATAIDDASALSDTIIGTLLKGAQNGVIEPAQITAVTYDVLARFDKAAAVSYKAFHPIK